MRRVGYILNIDLDHARGKIIDPFSGEEFTFVRDSQNKHWERGDKVSFMAYTKGSGLRQALDVRRRGFCHDL